MERFVHDLLFTKDKYVDSKKRKEKQILYK